MSEFYSYMLPYVSFTELHYSSSAGGVNDFPGQAACIACKHAVIGLTRTAALTMSQEYPYQYRILGCYLYSDGGGTDTLES